MASIENIIEGLQVVLKYEPEKNDICACAAEHDVFYAGRTPPDKMKPEDVAKLEELGWLWDDDTLGWFKFT